MKIPYKAIQLEDADIFSLDGIHKKYWKEFFDACHMRLGYKFGVLGDETYEHKYDFFKQLRFFPAEGLKWDLVMNWKVKKEDIERFQEAFDFFRKLETEDNAALPMLLVLLRMQQSISDRLRDDIEMMDYLRPRSCDFDSDKYRMTYLHDGPYDYTGICDLPALEKKLLSGLKKEREWDEDWQYYLKHAKDVKKEGHLESHESAGSVSRDLVESIVSSFNQSLSDFDEKYFILKKLHQGNATHAVIYRLFMSYMSSQPEVRKIIDEYPDDLGVRKLITTRASLIEEIKQSELGRHWYNCILLDNGLELVGKFYINHQDTITEEEEKRFFYLLDEINIITDVLKGKAKNHYLLVEYCETDEMEQGLTIANEGKKSGSVADVDNDNKNVVVQNITVHGDVVLKKETNIGTNYGPNIEHNGGTLKLPEEK